MTEEQTLGKRWRESRPSKAMLFWACLACVVLALIVGFTWGGWMTGGTAKRMAESAAKHARADLVATVCVERFLGATDAEAQLAALKDTSSWQRRKLIDEGGWTKIPGVEGQVPEAVRLCAERLADATLPKEEATNNSSATTVQ